MRANRLTRFFKALRCCYEMPVLNAGGPDHVYDVCPSRAPFKADSRPVQFKVTRGRPTTAQRRV